MEIPHGSDVCGGAYVDKQDGERERRSHGGVSVGLNLRLLLKKKRNLPPHELRAKKSRKIIMMIKRLIPNVLIFHRFSFPLNAALIDSETAEYSHSAQAQICV